MKLIFYLILYLLFANITSAHSKNDSPKLKKSRKLISALADTIIEYFDLEKKLIADKFLATNDDSQDIEESFERNPKLKCDEVNSFSDYFLNVYSEERNIDESDLDNLIKYQVKGPPKDNFTEYRSKIHKCSRNRKKVPTFFSTHLF